MSVFRITAGGLIALGLGMGCASEWSDGSSTPPLELTEESVGSYSANRHVVRNVPATCTFVRFVFLRRGQRVEVRVDPSSVTDPVAHLWDVSNRVEAGFSDNAWGLDRGARVTVPHDGYYRLIVRAKSSSSAGRADVCIDGLCQFQDIPVGGNFVTPKIGLHTYRYHVGFVPGGATDSVLFAMRNGHLHEYSTYEVGRQATTASDDFDSLYVARPVATSTCDGSDEVAIFANDIREDGDGDGLGVRLEEALGTCDPSAYEPPAYCDGLPNPQDSDRDGLSDSAEVLGLADDPWDFRDAPLYLAKWGASAVHKDVFIEIDQGDGLNVLAEPDEMLEELAAFFDGGTGDDLGNPDGRGGIAIHADIGLDPTPDTSGVTEHRALTLYGDWNPRDDDTLPEPDYDHQYSSADHALRAMQGEDLGEGSNRYFARNRQGVFHYVFLSARNDASTQGGRVVSLDCSRGRFPIATAAHELGHALGMSHGGTAGEPNQKPNYPSTMNYRFGSSWGFSEGLLPTLNPTSLDERLGLGPNATSEVLDFMRRSGYRITTDRSIDWNGNGVIDNVRVRGNVYVGTHEMSLQGRSLLTPPAAETPVTDVDLARLGSWMYAFFSDENGPVYRFTRYEPNQHDRMRARLRLIGATRRRSSGFAPPSGR